MLQASKEKTRYFPRVVIIAVEDDLFYWSDHIAEKVEKIESVYLVDTSVVTYLCSPQPCYFAIPLYPVVHFKPEYEEDVIGDIAWDRNISEIEEGWHLGTDPTYFGCFADDSPIIKHHDKMTFREKKDYVRTIKDAMESGMDADEAEEKARDEYIEYCREYFNGNHMY